MTTPRPREVSPHPEFNLPIKDPFPIPPISTALVQKEFHDQRLGLKLRSEDTAVLVDRISPDSPLQGSTVKVGSEILAVNGEAVHTAPQTSRLLGAYHKIEITTLNPESRPASPFCYIEVAPTSKINPGVSFESCCHGTLVMIGQVFVGQDPQTGKRRTRVKRGDLVLAVQGQAVYQAHDATRLQIDAARQSQACVLYCVDMDGLRRHICQGQGLRYQPIRENNKRYVSTIKQVAPTVYQMRDHDCIFVAVVNPVTQLLEDETPWNRRIKNIGRDSKGMVLKFSYASVCVPTFEYMNQCLTQQLQMIQLRTVSAAWKHLMQQQPETTVFATPASMAYSVPSAPVQPLEFGSTFSASLPEAQAFLVEDVAED